ncbi:hypothetical protein CPAR01_03573 [Colletotrichum paranaense]|uniref:Uncharacterized protein n=1 Tax=Colletotrichum paranaense TaxID=1914294 RepID=A0ABQ9STU6_9PEZI|nr:uncharacterized protein CPAR01_03573 [Colletotrichum paranaense]KAK1542940.1 hypothetical protein CPAR01_03573 [Colletotrichum paranaense]
MVVSSDMTLERREARRKMRTPDAMQNPDRRVPWTFEKPATHVRENAGALPFSTCAHLKFSHRNPRVLLHIEAGGGAPQNKKRPGEKSKEETMDEKQHRHAYTHTHTHTHTYAKLQTPAKSGTGRVDSGDLGFAGQAAKDRHSVDCAYRTYLAEVNTPHRESECFCE